MTENDNQTLLRFRIAAEIAKETEYNRRFTGGVSDKEIDKDSKLLKLPIIGTFREFLRHFGSEQDEGFAGIDLKYGNRIGERTKIFWEDGLPNTHIVVYVGNDSEPAYSINTAEFLPNGEPRMYQFMWFPEVEDLEPIDCDFGEFFERVLEIESKVTKRLKRK